MSEQKLFPAEIKAVDTKQGLVTAIVSVFGNVDAVNDVVLPGAFRQTIADWKAKMARGQFLPVVYGHRDDPRFIVGKVTDLRETTEGLEVDEKYFLPRNGQGGNPVAVQAFEAIEGGVLSGSSFSYDVQKAKANSHGGLDLAQVSLIEVGPTLYPANDATRLVGVKAMDGSAWDANRAMGMCEAAADYRAVCAAEHMTGTPDQRQHWAGPHHYLGQGPNEAGVQAALSRWGTTMDNSQVQDISEAEWSHGLSHLRAHMKEINPDYQPPGASHEPDSKHQGAPGYIQSAHDALVKAGAKCAAPSASTSPNGKSEEPEGAKDDDRPGLHTRRQEWEALTGQEGRTT